jgi:hypothetical protein
VLEDNRNEKQFIREAQVRRFEREVLPDWLRNTVAKEGHLRYNSKNAPNGGAHHKKTEKEGPKQMRYL